MSFTHPNVEAAQAALKTIGFREPFYIVDAEQHQGNHIPLTEGERAYWQGKASTLAATSPVMDLVYRNGALRYAYQGRGFCCVLWRGAFRRTQSEVIGSVLHEGAHYLTYAAYPERSERDPCRAMQMFSANSHFNSAAHGEQFLRACVNLWQRALNAGYDVAFEHVIDTDHYGFSSSQVAAAIGEAVRWRDKPLGAVELLLALPKESPSAPAPRSVAATTPPILAEPKLVAGDGEPVWQFPDGRIGVPGQAAGSIIESFPTLNAYWQARSQRRVGSPFITRMGAA